MGPNGPEGRKLLELKAEAGIERGYSQREIIYFFLQKGVYCARNGPGGQRIKSHQNLDLPDSSWKSFEGARGSWLCKLINGEASSGICFLSVLWLAFYLRAADVSGWTRVLQLILKPNNSMKLKGRTLCRWSRPGTAVKIFKNGYF